MVRLNNILQVLEFIKARLFFIPSETLPGRELLTLLVVCGSQCRQSVHIPKEYLSVQCYFINSESANTYRLFITYHNLSYTFEQFYKEISRKQSLFFYRRSFKRTYESKLFACT